jgi:hypothetical protein
VEIQGDRRRPKSVLPNLRETNKEGVMIHIAASNWPLTAGQSARALCNKLVHESRFVPIWDDQEMNAPIEARGNICGKCRKQPIAGTFVYALLPKERE